jgi:polyhydroxyalkanoate synthesis regulator phasin
MNNTSIGVSKQEKPIMSEQIEILEEEVTEAKNVFLGGLRRVLMAGIGAVALAQEEIEDFVNKLVERGEIAEKDGRKLIDDIKERRQQKAEEAEEKLEQRFEGILERMNVPSRRDIRELNEKIAMLAEKVDTLKAE